MSDKNFPTPEELQSKLNEFMKANFGDKVSFATVAQTDNAETGVTAEPPEVEPEEPIFDKLPRDIKAHLDRYVIRQDDAKKVLAIAVCDHYNHIRQVREDRTSPPGGPGYEGW